MAVMAAIPPEPRVYSNFWLDSGSYERTHPLVIAARAGSAIAKGAQVRKAQARLDSALQYVDVPEIIARETVVNTADFMGLTVANRTKDADYILDLRIEQYGIDADSWQGATSMIIRGDVLIYENTSKRAIWKKELYVRERLSPRMFGISPTVGNIFTARDLSRLSAKEMETGFRNLSDFAAARISEVLREDYARSRK